ncbi:MAG: CDP-archaeol synthase, partial [Clostridia bacterium]|nr:CDP-archaeol synthase [Clostridia bacterium]
LCPKISPKKTVEGAVSGVIIGTLLTLIVGVIFENFIFFDGCYVNYIFLAIYGLLGALVSIVGDLSFSLIKRSFGIKDYGSLIPGHGGMLDRFDSVIFYAPLLLIFNMILPIIVISKS